MAAAVAFSSKVVVPSSVAVSASTKTSRGASARVNAAPKAIPAFQGLKASVFNNKLSVSAIESLMGDALRARKCGVAQASRVNTTMAMKGMNIVFVSSEVSPWSKTGGLGDVLGGLPAALAARGHRVMTIAPRYDQYRDAWDTEQTVSVPVGEGVENVRFFHTYKRGVDRVFVDHPLFLAKVWGKTGSKIYGETTGTDYEDNQMRFSLFCQAAIEAPRRLDLKSSDTWSGPYGEDIIFVANDWHSALVPVYLKHKYQPAGMYKNAKVALCTHNIAYQGRFARDDFSRLNLPAYVLKDFAFEDGYSKPVKGPKINWLKAGFLNADLNLTVSPNYATEMVSGPALGVELDNVIKQVGGMRGIINGMDVQEWDPMADKFLDIKYDATSISKKSILKEALQAEVGLPVDPKAPLFAFIGRLEEQKGSDILEEAIPKIVAACPKAQIVVLGTGKKSLEKPLEKLEDTFPDNCRGIIRFDTALAHLMTAGADFMLVPSRFEPCGLIQLHAMRYGTVPVVASTGGLVDTVVEGTTGYQMGAMDVDCDAVDPKDVAKVVNGVKRAVADFGTPKFDRMRQNCMAQDLSWKGPSLAWEETLLQLATSRVTIGSKGLGSGDEIGPKAKENVATP